MPSAAHKVACSGRNDKQLAYQDRVLYSRRLRHQRAVRRCVRVYKYALSSDSCFYQLIQPSPASYSISSTEIHSINADRGDVDNFFCLFLVLELSRTNFVMSSATTKLNRWFVIGDGISPFVLAADINRFLGPEARLKEQAQHEVEGKVRLIPYNLSSKTDFATSSFGMASGLKHIETSRQ